MSDTREICTLSATYVAKATQVSYHLVACSRATNGPAHTSCQSICSYAVLLTQAVKYPQHMPVYSAIAINGRAHTSSQSSIHNICRYTQPPVGCTGLSS
ncbi:DNA-directed RNA polymerase subunit beta'' [Gossypium arboreum]|uniref:DNA-directed RNA polymerase subunit beta n=1 Tax=Gossypium arboreum TaxID=29729 RepID=A0A0B0P8F4_GOSAR|nr:DNA-directed RNA polymerase subunit beta'' [Gossypium arboreum]